MSHPRPLLLLPLALLGLACAGLGKPEPEDTGNTPAVTVETDCGDDRDDDGDGATDCGDPDCVDVSPCNEGDADADADADGDADADTDTDTTTGADTVYYFGTTHGVAEIDVSELVCEGAFTLRMDWSTGEAVGTTDCAYMESPVMAGDVYVSEVGSRLEGSFSGDVLGYYTEASVSGVGDRDSVTLSFETEVGPALFLAEMNGAAE